VLTYKDGHRVHVESGVLRMIDEGIDHETGSLRTGKGADIVLMDDRLSHRFRGLNYLSGGGHAR
jgi:urease alpha subunit